MNLNDYSIKDEYGNNALKDQSTKSQSANSIVYFRNLENELIKHLKNADAIFGAVAWLTNEKILQALADVENVQIIVQKEDFLRPDCYAPWNWKDSLREQYDALNCGIDRYEFPNLLAQADFAGDPEIEPVRCVGNHNSEQHPAFPRMHNKFIVFAKIEYCEHGERQIIPYAVWSGSFNFTQNSVLSYENAIYMTDPEIVSAYFKEYGQIAAISEPLDWTSEWVAPEWRIGS